MTKTQKIILVITILLVVWSVTTQGVPTKYERPERTWLYDRGDEKALLIGSLIESDGDTIVIRDSEGKTFFLNYRYLSLRDKHYLETLK